MIKIPTIDQSVVDLLDKAAVPVRNFLSESLNSVSGELSNQPALYIFWWIGDKALIKEDRRIIQLKGPKEEGNNHKWITVNWNFPDDSDIPIPLYVGKTTNLKQRISQHLRLKSESHEINETCIKKGSAKTTSCQVRYGLDYLFPNRDDLIPFISDKVGLSYLVTGNADQDVVDRFYQEDLLIGLLKPWFNVDTER